MQNDVVEKLKAVCNDYSDILGLVILFGSYSRDEATSESDIDLYIEPKDRTVTTYRFGRSKKYKEFKIALYDSIDKEFDLLTYGGVRDISSMRKSPLWKQINKDGILIHGQRTESI